ncbi:MAG TPA: 4-oxalocrotonate tautomerase [Candidatus Deferrimicrobium sp.]|nr:4-oxalocrotonate tautomerase [Candidatus Deferrimicrobium sp.]
MPIVQVEILEGRTVEQKRAMVKKVTEALCETLICPPENVTIVIREMSKEHLAKGGKLAIDN